MLGDLITGYVGSHDEDGILAVNGLPLAICQAALVGMRDGNTQKAGNWASSIRQLFTNALHCCLSL